MRGNISVFNIVKSMSKQKQSMWILKQLLWRKEEKGDIAKIKMTMDVYSVGFCGWIRLWSRCANVSKSVLHVPARNRNKQNSKITIGKYRSVRTMKWELNQLLSQFYNPFKKPFWNICTLRKQEFNWKAVLFIQTA